MIERIVPLDVAVGECFTDLEEQLFPEEEAFVAKAVPKRRQEFRTVRGCARTALAALGIERAALVPGPRGAPSWPLGVVGSMTHCAGYRSAVAAWARVWAGLGIDAEPNAPLPAGVLETVASPEERAHLSALRESHPETCWDRLLFSAKESVYKVWSPLEGTWLGFEQVRLAIDPHVGTFDIDLSVTESRCDPRHLATMTGRFLVDHGLLLTAVTAPAKSDCPL